jgi:hypothetical protein
MKSIETGNCPSIQKCMRYYVKVKKWILVGLAIMVTASWQSSCACKSNGAAKEAFFAPGSIKFQRVYK